MLDAEGLVKLSAAHPDARSRVQHAYRRGAEIVTAASTLAEVLRGGRGDAPMHYALARVTVLPLGREQGRAAGELLGRTGLSGHRCALGALLAVVALAQPRPVILLTSDARDMARLTEEPDRPVAERVVIVRV